MAALEASLAAVKDDGAGEKARRQEPPLEVRLRRSAKKKKATALEVVASGSRSSSNQIRVPGSAGSTPQRSGSSSTRYRPQPDARVGIGLGAARARSRGPGRRPRRAATRVVRRRRQPDRVAGLAAGVADRVGDELGDEQRARRACASPPAARRADAIERRGVASARRIDAAGKLERRALRMRVISNTRSTCRPHQRNRRRGLALARGEPQTARPRSAPRRSSPSRSPSAWPADAQLARPLVELALERRASPTRARLEVRPPRADSTAAQGRAQRDRRLRRQTARLAAPTLRPGTAPYRDEDFAYSTRPAARRRADAHELGHPARLEGRLDLPVTRRPPAGDGHRRRRPQAVPLPRRLARAARRREVRRHGRASPARCRGCASSVERRPRRPRRARRASACWPAPCGCSTAASSASAPRSTRSRTSPTGWRRCARSTSRIEDDGTMVFDYPAKSGQRRIQARRRPAGDATSSRALKRRRGGGDGAARLQGGPPLARRPLRRHQRLPQGGHRRRLLGQGLPHLERDGAGRASRSPSPARWRRTQTGAQARDHARGQGGRRTTSATRRRSAAPPTSTRACSTPTRAGWSSAARCEAAPTPSPASCRSTSRRSRRAVLDLIDERERAPGVERVAA